MKFVRRELRRGNHYDALILDPPSYGHGPRGEVWQFDRLLPELLSACAELARPAPQFVLLTCHTPGYSPVMLRELLAGLLPTSTRGFWEARELVLRAASGRGLPSGLVLRWKAHSIE
jgi:23S rRNA (cytosine1962-C5)-methyltransferase